MKKTRILLLALSILIVSVVPFQIFGDDSDPLISKSYLDKRIGQVDDKIGDLGDKISGLEAKVKENQNQNKDDKEVQVPKAAPVEGSEKTYKPIRFEAGQSVYLGEGTEFILRSGVAKIIDPASIGIPDLTNGDNMLSGDRIQSNHIFMCPRNDGRGIYAQTEIWVMIKGSYSLGGKAGMSETAYDVTDVEEL